MGRGLRWIREREQRGGGRKGEDMKVIERHEYGLSIGLLGAKLLGMKHIQVYG